MAELELGVPTERHGAKKPNLMKKIGTHNGTFHCDEVLACFMLKQLPEYGHADIIRTRDPKVLAKCDIVVDVGGEYNPEKHYYDHHQRYMYCRCVLRLWSTVQECVTADTSSVSSSECI